MVLALLIRGASGASTRNVGWALTESPAGTAFTIVIDVSGSSCVSHDRVTLDETLDRVVVRAFNNVSRSNACTNDYREYHHVVQLDAPLGDRRLVGCTVTGDAIPVTGPSIPDDADCTYYIQPSALTDIRLP